MQQCIEEKLSILLQSDISIVGAGRTDAGVHARMMVAHFDSPKEIEDPKQLVGKLNSMLPKDIAIEKIISVADDAHARFDAVSRIYQYIVCDKKNPFEYEWVCRMSLRDIDFVAMNEAAKVLPEYTDFTSFSKLHTDVKTNNCKVEFAKWLKKEDKWIFTIKADRFLRNMVRAIVGTLFEVGRGKLSVDGFRKIIEAKDRCKAGTSAPAEGLAIIDIKYKCTIDN